MALKRSFVASVPTIAEMNAQNLDNIVVFLKINKCYTINFYGSIRSRYNQNNFLANLSLRNVFICCENQVLSSSDGYFSWNFVLSLLVPIYVLFRGEQRYSLQTFRNTVDPKTQQLVNCVYCLRIIQRGSLMCVCVCARSVCLQK